MSNEKPIFSTAAVASHGRGHYLHPFYRHKELGRAVARASSSVRQAVPVGPAKANQDSRRLLAGLSACVKHGIRPERNWRTIVAYKQMLELPLLQQLLPVGAIPRRFKGLPGSDCRDRPGRT